MMQKSNCFISGLLIGAFVLFTSSLSQAENKQRVCLSSICFKQAEKDHQFLIAPYLYAPSVSGDAGIEGVSASFDYTAEELSSGLNAGGMGYVQWQRGVDFYYLEGLGLRYKDRVSAFLDRLLNVELGLLELGYGRNYCLSSGERSDQNCSFMISPYGGLRHTRLDLSIRLNEGGLEGVLLGLSGFPNVYQAEERWVDPVVGLFTRYTFNNYLSVYTKLDAAGLGIAYNDYWNAMAVINFQVSSHWSVAAGYRKTRFDADPGGGNKVRLKLRGEGPVVGLVYNF